MDVCLTGKHQYIAKSPFSPKSIVEKSCRKGFCCLYLTPAWITACCSSQRLLHVWGKHFWPLALICCIKLRLCLNTCHVSSAWDSWYPAGRRVLPWKIFCGISWERRVLWELSSLSSLEGGGKGRGTQILPHGQLCCECTGHNLCLGPHWTYPVKLCVVVPCNDWVSDTY